MTREEQLAGSFCRARTTARAAAERGVVCGLVTMHAPIQRKNPVPVRDEANPRYHPGWRLVSPPTLSAVPGGPVVATLLRWLTLLLRCEFAALL